VVEKVKVLTETAAQVSMETEMMMGKKAIPKLNLIQMEAKAAITDLKPTLEALVVVLLALVQTEAVAAAGIQVVTVVIEQDVVVLITTI
jgi:ribonuclease D